MRIGGFRFPRVTVALPRTAPASRRRRGSGAGGGGSQLAGLDWNGNPSARRAIVFTNVVANGLPMYPATYIWKIFQRNQVSGIGDASRYYTTFFWGNDGAFDWGPGYVLSYYGFHPYPTPTNTNDGKWEIALDGNDFFLRDDGSSPYVTNDRWYSQAAICSIVGGGTYRHKFYVDLPNVNLANTITRDRVGQADPPSPCLIWAQAPDNGSGQSWGGYSRWEEQNAIIRGAQVYNAELTEIQVVALAAKETDADVLNYCSINGISSLWYLNMNWLLGDIGDKSGAGHHPAWAGIARPTQWIG